MNKIKNFTTTAAGVSNFESIPGIAELGAHAFAIQARQSVDILLAYSPNPSEYITVKAGSVRSVSWSGPQRSLRIFVKCATVGTVVELELTTVP